MEFVLYVDYQMLDLPIGLLQQPAQRPAFSRSGVRLHKHAGFDQAREIDFARTAGEIVTERDAVHFAPFPFFGFTFALFFAHRAVTAFRALSLRCWGVNFKARAWPPRRPASATLTAVVFFIV